MNRDAIIQDLQLRLMEKGAEIEALRGEIKRLKAANADQQTVLQNKDGQLDRLGESFSHAPLGRHVVAWLRSRW